MASVSGWVLQKPVLSKYLSVGKRKDLSASSSLRGGKMSQETLEGGQECEIGKVCLSNNFYGQLGFIYTEEL